jgi:hypothetical protein
VQIYLDSDWLKLCVRVCLIFPNRSGVGAGSRKSGTKHLLAGIILDLLHAVFLDHLHRHALEVDGQASLQLVRAHAQDLHALVEADVRVVVLVED